MSTILDALRKLQRERTAANPSRDLRGSVTDEIPMPQPRRSPPRRGLVFGLVAALAILIGGGTWLYKRGVFTRAPAAPAEVAAGQAAEAGGQPEEFPTEAELDELQRETSEREAAAGGGQPPVAASPNPPPDVPAPNADEAAAERVRLEEVRRAAAAAEAERQQAEARAAADAAADAATAVNEAEPPAAAIVAPTPAAPPAPPAPAAGPVLTTKAQTPKAAQAPAVAPEPKPVAKPKPAPKAKPAAPPAPARREPPPDGSASAAASDGFAPTAFPDIRVESIRWHPLAERRAASLRFAQQNVPDAHEGDIIGGVLVFRIEPGAVELRVGSTSHVVRPTP